MGHVTTYNPMPISFTHGNGVWLYDKTGKQYLDSFSGIAVCGLGHAHPDVTHTIQQQAAKLIHTSNAFHIQEQEELADKLAELTGMTQVFFSNSGAEANEAAIKLARLYGHKKNIEDPAIIVMEGAFHGRTMATLSASSSNKIRAGFEPFVPGFIRVPFNNKETLNTIASQHKNIVAIMLEPIQGESGVIVADDDYLQHIEILSKQHEWLVILDEVQTGNGRTGKLFSYMNTKIEPDIVTTAKGLGNGVPLGVTLIHKRACDLFKPGNHGSTFGGNPLASATALTVLNVIEREHLCERVAHHGPLLKKKLESTLSDYQAIRDIRGKGYMLGIEFDRPAALLKTIGLEYGILLNITSETVLRLLPPLIISDNEINIMIEKLLASITHFLCT